MNREIQKGIYDKYILGANHFLQDLETEERIIEIAFILNAHHGLRLVHTFDAKVSVELHTDLAHDIEKSIHYGERFHQIDPDHFIVKVPLTPSGYISTRKIRERGIPVNFTLNFSVRQNLIATIFSKPSFVNVFLGRLNAYVIDNNLGDGNMVGEKTTLASQRIVSAYSGFNPEPTRQEMQQIQRNGKIPLHKRWYKRIKDNTVSIDALMNMSGLASFTLDQQALDNKIRSLIQ